MNTLYGKMITNRDLEVIHMRYYLRSDNSFSPLMISHIGFDSDIADTRFGPGQRNLYIVHYIIKGEGSYNGNIVKQGQGFLIYPGQLEEYHANIDNPWEFLWVISSDSTMKGIFDRYKAESDTLIFTYDSVSTVKKIADDIISKNNEILDALDMLELFLKIFNSHVKMNTLSTPKSNAELYLDFCKEYIDGNIYRKITVTELTQRLGVSRTYLYKIFSDKFNMSPKQYIMWNKLNYAKKMLLETDMTITQISNSVGYYDSLAFSKAFSLKEGISPQMYRRRKKE